MDITKIVRGRKKAGSVAGAAWLPALCDRNVEGKVDSPDSVIRGFRFPYQDISLS